MKHSWNVFGASGCRRDQDCLRRSAMAEATCGRKRTECCPRSDQKSAQGLKIMAVVKGELGLRGSAVKQILF